MNPLSPRSSLKNHGFVIVITIWSVPGLLWRSAHSFQNPNFTPSHHRTHLPLDFFIFFSDLYFTVCNPCVSIFVRATVSATEKKWTKKNHTSHGKSECESSATTAVSKIAPVSIKLDHPHFFNTDVEKVCVLLRKYDHYADEVAVWDTQKK